MPACPLRFALDLRQLADEIEHYAAQQHEKDEKIRELLGVPKNVSFMK